jgi:hypothetical protein
MPNRQRDMPGFIVVAKGVTGQVRPPAGQNDRFHRLAIFISMPGYALVKNITLPFTRLAIGFLDFTAAAYLATFDLRVRAASRR